MRSASSTSTGWRGARCHERSGDGPSTPCNRRRDGNGWWLRPSLCAQPPRRWLYDGDRPREAWHIAPQAGRGLHRDFADCSALAGALSGQDAAVFCLGAYTGAAPDAELRTITVDYTIEFARVLLASSPDAAFSFLSGSGADPTGRSRLAFALYKGEAEKALLAAGSPAFTYFGPRISTPRSRARNRISATGCCE